MNLALRLGSPSFADEAEKASSYQKKTYHRYTPHQIERLELVFKECSHPNKSQRHQLAIELGLDPNQIGFWFQNKRTQNKTLNERAGHSALRAKNERLKCENRAMKKALQNVICKSCDGSPSKRQDNGIATQQLKLENTKMKDEYEKLTTFLATYIGRSTYKLETPAMTFGDSSIMPLGSLKQVEAKYSIINPNISSSNPNNTTPLPSQLSTNPQMENTSITDIAATSMDELISLLQLEEPLWIKSFVNQNYVLDRVKYDKLFPKVNHFKTSTARVEASKDSRVVCMSSVQLVDMFLNADKWAALFPTIITQARTIQILSHGKEESHDGVLQLMYQQIHSLSPLVPPREFYFIRHCKQIRIGVWAIADTSNEISKEPISSFLSWRLPSGCIIQDMPYGCSKVTWVEHVEVDDKSQTTSLYKDLLCGNLAYGAERWVLTLQRMCERLNIFQQENAPTSELEVINSPQGRRNFMQLACVMIQKFCSTLSVMARLDIPQAYMNNSGVQIHYGANDDGMPNGVVMSAAASVSLPWSHDKIFNVLKDLKIRAQWDILTNKNPVRQTVSITTGFDTRNCISILEPVNPLRSGMVILQETSMDAIGSTLVYGPMDKAVLNVEITNNESSVPILPSGFIISPNGCPTSSGSLLTVVLQLLASSPSTSSQLDPKSLDIIKRLITFTIDKVKAALSSTTFA